MKYSTTEKYFTNCPNCGASLGPNDKFCTYCGTRIVYERTFTQEDTYSMDMNRVDIESKADSSYSGFGGALGIAFVIFWCVVVFFIGSSALSSGAPSIFGLVPFGMLAFGIAMLVKMINGRNQYKSVVENAPRYQAIVLDHQVYTETRGSGEDRHTVTLAKVKVLANMNGSQKVILIKVGEPSNAAKYPEGSQVTIAGNGDYFVIL